MVSDAALPHANLHSPKNFLSIWLKVQHRVVPSDAMNRGQFGEDRNFIYTDETCDICPLWIEKKLCSLLFISTGADSKSHFQGTNVL